MKRFKYLILLLTLAACHNKGSKITGIKSDTTANKIEVKNQIRDTSFKPYSLKGSYYVTDTGYYNITIGDGVYAVIKKDNKLIDTIDLSYGINRVEGNKFLYYTIKGEGQAKKEDANHKYKKSIMASLGNYILINNEKKNLLSDLAPNFDDYFSSPSTINQNIFYWQIKKIDTTGKIAVLAAQFNPVTKKTTSHYIKDDYLETDDSGYFPFPYLKNDTIYFDAGKDKLMKFSKDFKPYN